MARKRGDRRKKAPFATSGARRAPSHVERRRARKMWRFGRGSFPVAFEVASVHERRRAVETSKFFDVSRKKAAALASECRLKLGMDQALARSLKDCATGVYGVGRALDAKLDDITSWARDRAQTTGDATAESAAETTFCKRIPMRVVQLARQACARASEADVVNGDRDAVDAYIDEHASVCGAGVDSDADTEFGVACERRMNALVENVGGPFDAAFDGKVKRRERGVGLEKRLRRVAWGFATPAEAERVADACARRAVARAHAERAETGVREVNEDAVTQQATKAVMNAFELASRAVRELSVLHQLLTVNVPLISRLETMVGMWAESWTARGGETRLYRTWINSAPDRVLAAAMRLIAGEWFYGRERVARFETEDTRTVQVALEGTVVSAKERREIARGAEGALNDRQVDFTDEVNAHVEELKKLRRDFDSFAAAVLLQTQPHFAEFSAEGAGGEGEERRLTNSLLDGQALTAAASRIASNSMTAMRTHAKRRFEKLVEAELGAMQHEATASVYAWQQRGRRGAVENARAAEKAKNMRAFLGTAARRLAIVKYASHFLRYTLSSSYAGWCDDHEVSVEPRKKLKVTLDAYHIDLDGVVAAVEARFRELVPWCSQQDLNELVSVISRGRFETEKDRAQPYDVLATFTTRVKARVRERREALVRAFGGRPRAVWTPTASLFDRDAVRRFSIERAIERVWTRTFANVFAAAGVRPDGDGDSGSFAATFKRKDDGGRMFGASCDRRLMKSIAREILRQTTATELAGSGRDAPFVLEGDDAYLEEIRCALEQKVLITASGSPLATTAAAANAWQVELGRNAELRTCVSRTMVRTMACAAGVIEDIDALCEAATRARDTVLPQGDALDGNARADDDDEDENEDAGRDGGVARVSKRVRASIKKEMARAVDECANGIVDRAFETLTRDSAGERADDDGESSPRTPPTTSSKDAEDNGGEGDAGAEGDDDARRYWLPRDIGGACVTMSQPGLGTRAQMFSLSDVARLSKRAPCVDEDAILSAEARAGGEGELAAIRDERSARGEWFARTFFAPDRAGLARTPPTSSGSFYLSPATISFNYKDKVAVDEESARTRTPRVAVQRDVKARDVVLAGFDPGMNKTLTGVIVTPETAAAGSDEVTTYRAIFWDASARSLHAASKPALRAKRNAAKRIRARDRAVNEDRNVQNEIALQRSAYGVSAEKTCASVARDRAYGAAAHDFVDAVLRSWRDAAKPSDETQTPVLIIACGSCGVSSGRGWSQSPMKGAPRTSPGRLVKEIVEAAGAAGVRCELDFVDEHSTSQLCPQCDTRLKSFRRSTCLFPANGPPLAKERGRRNGRVCPNTACVAARDCRNRDHVAAVNMIRKVYVKERDDAKQFEYERELIARALRDAFRVGNPSIKKIERGDDDDDDDDDVDTDDEVEARDAAAPEQMTLAQRASPAGVRRTRAMGEIATASQRARSASQRSPASPDARHLRQRVRSPQTEDARELNVDADARARTARASPRAITFASPNRTAPPPPTRHAKTPLRSRRKAKSRPERAPGA